MGSTIKGEYIGKEKRRPPVPKKEEKPILGLTSDKNYIVANAVENILAAPKVKDNNGPDYTKKKDYAEMPKYLQKIKKWNRPRVRARPRDADGRRTAKR